jgi:putative flippase GtrA
MPFARYIAVGLLTYGIDMGVFLFFLNFVVEGPLISNLIAKVAAGIFAFLSHRSFTFRIDKRNHEKKQIVRYLLLLLLSVPLSVVALKLILPVLDKPVIAKFVADVICVLFSYWFSKTWVFAHDRQCIVLRDEERSSP